MSTIGVVGLGIMGGAIARHLVGAGHQVHGCDISQEACKDAESFGVTISDTASSLADRVDIAITSLPSPETLQAVVDDIARQPRSNLIVVECSTLGLSAKQAAHDRLATAGGILLDCPLSGTGSQAVSGDLVVLGSGDEAAFNRVLPVLAEFSRRQEYVGPFGAGTKMKLVANTLIATHIAAAAEAIALADRSGLDPTLVHRVLAGSPAASSMFDVRGEAMTQNTYEPAQMSMKLFQKDLDLIAEFATDAEANLPLYSAARPFFDAGARAVPVEDTAAIYKFIRG